MRIAIPVGEDQASLCPSFGRAPYFWVVDPHCGERSLHENAAASSEGGAGVRAAQIVLDLGAEALITQRLGKNAANVLKAAGVRLYGPKFGGVQANVGALLAGSLRPLKAIHPGYHPKAGA